ncbi:MULTISPECIES: entericidin A/B family lipoprotein [Nitrospirillum]|uniref:Putative small secreted protein n=1 Tax=Nitrospirillum amazonense TaxID=28077 RepID=A0A560FP62_9PROT|nr:MULTISPECIES: entericidin A/B family lipoprotein [Nitrospirillum]MDG3443944.1 entericidin A/B family lipoprotein [Nitrospirillum amazonense]MEA1675021.1 entericidin A/B family lipoprotein [Nitrospirillum sp. BR 11163]TWB23340.1 putative small secreted protein [Nitrospirillum amazonense]TWB77505.1 putative small secreted protein [Nitrospirillum amazonense]
MTTKLRALVLLSMLGMGALVSACHTTEGAGEDISATGHAISKEAHKDTP